MITADVGAAEFLPVRAKMTSDLQELRPFRQFKNDVVEHLENRRHCHVELGTRSEYRDMVMPRAIERADELSRYDFCDLIEDFERPMIVDDVSLDAIETKEQSMERDQFKKDLYRSGSPIDKEAYDLYQMNLLRRQNHMGIHKAQSLVDAGILDSEMGELIKLVKKHETEAYTPVGNDIYDDKVGSGWGGRTSTQHKIDFTNEYREFLGKVLDSIYGIQRPVVIDVGIPVEVNEPEEAARE